MFVYHKKIVKREDRCNKVLILSKRLAGSNVNTGTEYRKILYKDSACMRNLHKRHYTLRVFDVILIYACKRCMRKAYGDSFHFFQIIRFFQNLWQIFAINAHVCSCICEYYVYWVGYIDKLFMQQIFILAFFAER